MGLTSGPWAAGVSWMRARLAFSILAVFISAPALAGQANQAWRNATLIKISHVNEWCRHCPDWNQSLYSFRLEDGTVYVGRTQDTLDVTVQGHTPFRFEKDGHVGDHIHILDDRGKDRKLTITEKSVGKD